MEPQQAAAEPGGAPADRPPAPRPPPSHRAFDRILARYGPLVYLRLGPSTHCVVAGTADAAQGLLKHEASIPERSLTAVTRHLAYDDAGAIKHDCFDLGFDAKYSWRPSLSKGSEEEDEEGVEEGLLGAPDNASWVEPDPDNLLFHGRYRAALWSDSSSDGERPEAEAADLVVGTVARHAAGLGAARSEEHLVGAVRRRVARVRRARASAVPDAPPEQAVMLPDVGPGDGVRVGCVFGSLWAVYVSAGRCHRAGPLFRLGRKLHFGPSYSFSIWAPDSLLAVQFAVGWPSPGWVARPHRLIFSAGTMVDHEVDWISREDGAWRFTWSSWKC